MKKILVSAILLLGMSSILKAQENEESWSFPVTYSGSRPVITDFVSAILSREDIGESLGEMKANWDLYLQGKKLPEGRSFLVDVKNGYLRYDATDKDEDGTVYQRSIEYCYWNHSNGRNKLVGENTVCKQDGKVFMGQFSGVSYYLYDGKTRLMRFAYEPDLGIDLDCPEDTELIVHKLPQSGKTVEYHFYSHGGEKLVKYTWVGDIFIVPEE